MEQAVQDMGDIGPENGKIGFLKENWRARMQRSGTG